MLIGLADLWKRPILVLLRQRNDVCVLPSIRKVFQLEHGIKSVNRRQYGFLREIPDLVRYACRLGVGCVCLYSYSVPLMNQLPDDPTISPYLFCLLIFTNLGALFESTIDIFFR